MAYRIGVISDTHGLLRPEAKQYLKGCDMIFHAGDIGKVSVIKELNEIAATYAVQGNTDRKWAKCLPIVNRIEDIGIKVLMIHNKKDIHEDLSAYDLVIYGHSHRYEEKMLNGRTWLNPGSCGPRRFSLPVTMALLDVQDDGSFHIERLDLLHSYAGTEEKMGADQIKGYLPSIIKDIDRGLTVKQIAEKYHISSELSEEICRMYLTHPGVDADGIMGKMGI